MVTPLPPPFEQCDIRGGAYQRNESLLLEAAKVCVGLRVTCCDSLFSGHTVNVFLILLLWREYAHRKIRLYPYEEHLEGVRKAMSYVLLFIGSTVLIAMICFRFHYTIDIYIALLIVCLVFVIHKYLETEGSRLLQKRAAKQGFFFFVNCINIFVPCLPRTSLHVRIPTSVLQYLRVL